MTKTDFKSGYVTIIGKPNVGKSTLLNSILDFPLSSVSRKPQMTRHRILGILEGGNYQIIFTDTPGMLKPHYKLQNVMMNEVKKSVNNCDIVVLLVEPKIPDEDMKFLDKFKRPVILCINKIDLEKDKKKLLPIVDFWKDVFKFKDILLLSALKKINLDKLKEIIVNNLPEGPRYFDSGALTDRNERFYVAEIIREIAFDNFHEEIPYAISVVVEDFVERDRGKYYIKAIIYVESKSQKSIVIGAKGIALKRLGTQSRVKIEKFLSHDVYLELYVKVMEKWRKKSDTIKKLGYGS